MLCLRYMFQGGIKFTERNSHVCAQLRPTLCDPMDCSIVGFPVLHRHPEFAQIPSSRWCHLTISSSVVPFTSCPQSFPASGSFPVSQLFASGGQSVGASAFLRSQALRTPDLLQAPAEKLLSTGSVLPVALYNLLNALVMKLHFSICLHC